MANLAARSQIPCRGSLEQLQGRRWPLAGFLRGGVWNRRSGAGIPVEHLDGVWNGGVRLEQRFPTLRLCDENPRRGRSTCWTYTRLSDSRLILGCWDLLLAPKTSFLSCYLQILARNHQVLCILLLLWQNVWQETGLFFFFFSLLQFEEI